MPRHDKPGSVRRKGQYPSRRAQIGQQPRTVERHADHGPTVSIGWNTAPIAVSARYEVTPKT
ncbi:MAG: hypothetical protein ACK46X_18250, partial [Candidatus Sericytochromatia bacterium]